MGCTAYRRAPEAQHKHGHLRLSGQAAEGSRGGLSQDLWRHRLAGRKQTRRGLCCLQDSDVLVEILSPEEMVIAATQMPDQDFCLDPDVDIAYVRHACHNFMVVSDGLPETSAAAELQELEDDNNAKKPKAQMADAPFSKYRMRVVGEALPATGTYSRSICRFAHLSVREHLELRHLSIAEANAFMACISLRTLLRLNHEATLEVRVVEQYEGNDGDGHYGSDEEFEECPVLNVKVADRNFQRRLVWYDSDEETEGEDPDWLYDEKHHQTTPRPGLSGASFHLYLDSRKRSSP